MTKSATHLAVVKDLSERSLLLGTSDRMTKLRDLIDRVAPVDAAVLISGETGVGKELAAREIHRLSARSGARFVPVNCAAVPDMLFESILFGHVKGAFTGAHKSRAGKFVVADSGTLFLDEVGELPARLQTKLLRVLQEQYVEPVGATVGVNVDARIIAATNKNLTEEVDAGRFRRDLFYRLNVVPIFVPSLRKRREDILPLFDHYLELFNRKHRARTGPLTELARAALAEYDWPGNIRELIHCAERLVVLHPAGPVDLHQLPSGPVAEDPPLPDGGIDLRSAVATFERALIRQAMERSKGNKSDAAGLLNIARTTLQQKLKRHFDGETWTK